MGKRDLLAHIEKDIENMFETGRIGNLTPQQVNEIAFIYSNFLLIGELGTTIQEAVANWFKKYNFIIVCRYGIGWRIGCRG